MEYLILGWLKCNKLVALHNVNLQFKPISSSTFLFTKCIVVREDAGKLEMWHNAAMYSINLFNFSIVNFPFKPSDFSR